MPKRTHKTNGLVIRRADLFSVTLILREIEFGCLIFPSFAKSDFSAMSSIKRGFVFVVLKQYAHHKLCSMIVAEYDEEKMKPVQMRKKVILH